MERGPGFQGAGRKGSGGLPYAQGGGGKAAEAFPVPQGGAQAQQLLECRE